MKLINKKWKLIGIVVFICLLYTSKEFEGYDLVEDKLPTNAEGTMTISPIEVTYYYIYRTSVTVQYIDKITGNKLAEDIVINGHEKDAYTTEQKEFEGYDLVSEPSNKEGEMKMCIRDRISLVSFKIVLTILDKPSPIP